MEEALIEYEKTLKRMFNADNWLKSKGIDAWEDIKGSKAIFLTGTQGDSNHLDFFKPGSERIRGTRYGHSEYMGRSVADAVKALWDKVYPIKGQQIFTK